MGNCRLVPKAREERRTCVESAGGKGPGDGSGGAEHSERHGCYCSCTLDGTLGGAGEQFGGRGSVAAAACDRARADWSADVNSSRILESHSVRKARSGSPAPSTSTPLTRISSIVGHLGHVWSRSTPSARTGPSPRSRSLAGRPCRPLVSSSFCQARRPTTTAAATFGAAALLREDLPLTQLHYTTGFEHTAAS